jgi:uncharacterized protein with PIN domain
MASIYVDTSALGRVLLGEPDAELIRDTLAGYDTWRSSALLLVELRRFAVHRHGQLTSAGPGRQACCFDPRGDVRPQREAPGPAAS